MIENDTKHVSTSSRLLRLRPSKTDINLEFKPLVQVDPSVLLSTRAPLKNPRAGDYQLKQTASTEGIASKKSLELKKRYLLGENVLPVGIMKSDSTSILDSKLKNFHTTISGCQKLLNPAPDISPALQTFLKNTIASDGDSIAVQTLNSPQTHIVDVVNCEEKENVYTRIVNTKNELNKSDIPGTCKTNKSVKKEGADVVIDGKTEEIPVNAVETIDLVTPEKKSPLISIDVPKYRYKALENEIRMKPVKSSTESTVTIDLTGDSSCDRLPESPEHDSHKSDPVAKQKTSQSSNNPLKHYTCTNNYIAEENVQSTENKINLSESSTSTSSSSSASGIPHQILESTANTSTDATPIESREFMQMDSLMIVDGKYTGDPEDLKLMRMPEMGKNDNNVIEVKSPNPEPLDVSMKPYKYESIYKRPELKFDSKNENKIDSLRNLPLILPKKADILTLKVSETLELNIPDCKVENDFSDNDKTPTIANPESLISQTRSPMEEQANKSDSETETTGCICTETELSDWTADDAVSENFIETEFPPSSSKAMLTRNRRARSKMPKTLVANRQLNLEQKNPAPIATCFDIEGIDFMDTGSEDSCMEIFAATNDVMVKNRGYVQFVTANANCSYQVNSQNENKPIHEAKNKCLGKIGQIEFIEQGAIALDKNTDPLCVSKNTSNISNTLMQSANAIEESGHKSFNDADDESVVLNYSQGGGNTTTEESEALTIVTSPLESTPRIFGSVRQESPKQSSVDCSSELNSNKDLDDLTYGDYVRQLQMAITQISNARDSIDVRKTKRKHSKSEISDQEPDRLMQMGQQNKQYFQECSHGIDKKNKGSNKSLSIYVGSPAEPACTVIEKLEEITKERTKQKDLIHDLVMNKLQSKKQLNAEKRLNRSRNRSSALSLSPAPTALPPPPPHVATAKNCSTNVGDYEKNKSFANNGSDPKRNLRTSQRPLSDNVDAYVESRKLIKTKSFCVYEIKSPETLERQNESLADIHNQRRFDLQMDKFHMPVLPFRRNPEDAICQSVDKIYQDGKPRVRLSTNRKTGLEHSVDEKLISSRGLHRSESNAERAPLMLPYQSEASFTTPNKSDDMKVRERKMLASKSVNDIAATNSSLDNNSVRDHITYDFTSDSNMPNEKPFKRRQKDPERRKSIIQAVTEFFHKKKDKEQPGVTREKSDSVFGLFRITPKTKSKV